MKKTLIGLLALTLSGSALAWSQPTYSKKDYNELSFRLNKEGQITTVFSSQYSQGLTSKKVKKGQYDVNVKNFIKGVPYNKITVTCSINTGNQNTKQRATCYKVQGKPIIRILTSNMNDAHVNAITSVTLKW